MQQKILYIFTRTPLHVGAGSSVGAIDQPIQRERHTGFPIIPGSSLKGVLRDAVRRDGALNGKEEAMFGRQDEAGRLTMGEAKVLAFPVRSAKGWFAFITCRLALERFRRENAALTNIQVPDEPADMSCLAGEAVVIKRNGKTGVVLEEYQFQQTNAFPPEWEEALLGLLDDVVWKTGKGRFVMLSTGDFSHFVKTACEVSQHVAIDPAKGTARPGALFNLEAVPAETLFFAPIAALARSSGEIELLRDFLVRRPVMQFGGDSTTGLGFCSVILS